MLFICNELGCVFVAFAGSSDFDDTTVTLRRLRVSTTGATFERDATLWKYSCDEHVQQYARIITHVLFRPSNELDASAVWHLRMQTAVNTWHEKRWPQIRSVRREEDKILVSVVNRVSAFRTLLAPCFATFFFHGEAPESFFISLFSNKTEAADGDDNSIVNCQTKIPVTFWEVIVIFCGT